jgi:predicted amidophosphoribosyltransferase
MLGLLVDLLLPRRCAACGAGERLLCARCRTALVLLTGPRCERCGAPTAWPVERCAECSGRRLPFRTARAAVAYDGPARNLVAAWKERGLRALAAEAAELVVEVVARPAAAALTFVPGDRERTLWRGTNTAEALAEALGQRWELPVESLLERTGRVPRQRGLPRPQRRKNVREAFRGTGASAVVALVDDVYTTGATVGAAATELRRAGAREIHVVTFARAVRR